MSILDDLKKILFGAKAVAGSAADKVVEGAKQAGEQIANKTGEILENTGVDKVGGAVLDAANNAAEKVANVTENVGTKVMETTGNIAEKTGSIVESVGSKVMETGGAALEKAGNVAENVGTKIMDVGGDLMDKAGNTAENVGGIVLETAGNAVDKAKEAAGNIWEKTMDLVNKAQDEASKETIDETIVTVKETAKEAGVDVNDSLLEGKDDFFEKAKKFAEGKDINE